MGECKPRIDAKRIDRETKRRRSSSLNSPPSMFARFVSLSANAADGLRGSFSPVRAGDEVAEIEICPETHSQNAMHAGTMRKRTLDLALSFCDISSDEKQAPLGRCFFETSFFSPNLFFFFLTLSLRFPLSLSPSPTQNKKKAAAATTKLRPAAAKKASSSPAKPKTGTLRIGGTKKVAPPPAPARVATKKISAAPSSPPSGGTRKVTALSVFEKGAQFSQRELGEASVRAGGGAPPRILTRVSQLRLLSKVEQSGLLSALERNGVTLSALEKSGALTLAESLGLLSRAADRSTPSLLYTVAFALFAAGPAAVYFIPDGSTAGVVAQAAIAAAAVAGGAAAFGGANLLSALQK